MSVIVVDTNYDVGGHAIVSGGNTALGGGTTAQKKYGIEDSPDIVFRDLTDWSVVETSGMPDYRYNDRGVQRALADNTAKNYDFLVANGVVFDDRPPDNRGGHAIGISARRENHAIWDRGQSLESPAGANGTSLMRPLEASAREKGVRFLLNYHMDAIFRETPDAGRVLGIQASYSPTILPGTTTPLRSFRSEGNIEMTADTVSVRARKAIVIGTGGNSGNVNFRRIFDPRLTEEIPTAAVEYSPQDASGEMAAMSIGATLWGTANQTFDRNAALRKRPIVGTPTNYIAWTPDSPIFPKIRATGLTVGSWQNAIIVNQVGKRFYNEMENGYPTGTVEGFLDPYVPGDWRNPTKKAFAPMNYIDAALAINEGSVPPDYSAGPQWGHLRRDSRRAREMESRAACHTPRLFLLCPDARGTCGPRDEEPAPEGQDARDEPGSHGEAVQTRWSTLAWTPTSTSQRPGTRSTRHRSTPPGRRSRPTTPTPGSGST